MDNASLVQVLDPSEDGSRHLLDSFFRHGTFLNDSTQQIPSRGQFHDGVDFVVFCQDLHQLAEGDRGTVVVT